MPILIDPSRPTTQSTRHGLGDLRIGAAYDLPIAGFFASVRSGAMLPTASTDKGFDTGKAGYSVGADLAKPLGAVTTFAGVTYTMAGDPDGFDVHNSFSGQAGAALRLGKSTSATGLRLSKARLPQVKMTSASRKFSDGAPEVGGGVTLGFKFGR